MDIYNPEAAAIIRKLEDIDEKAYKQTDGGAVGESDRPSAGESRERDSDSN